MAHGGYGKRRVADHKPVSNRRPKGLGVDKKPKPKTKPKSVKYQIRSTERMLRKDIPPEVREAQEKKLEELKKQQETLNKQVEIHSRLAKERKIFLRDRKIRFFERRKIERRLRRLEKQQRASSDHAQEAAIAEQLSSLKEDLEYVRFFPKTEKYVSLFMGGDDTDTVDRRSSLRKQIKANIIAAAASGKDLEDTGSEDDGLLDPSEDDFFLAGSSSDEADADDEWTDRSTREQASSASGKAVSGMSSDERNQNVLIQRQISARALMPPPRPSKNSSSFHGKSRDSSSLHVKSRFGGSSSKKSFLHRGDMSTSSNTSNSRGTSNSTSASTRMGASSSRHRAPLDLGTGHSSNLSSNSDAWKPRRKRRPKKKKQQA